MTYELVYRSSKGNNNYWSVNERFTRKETGHFQWSSAIVYCKIEVHNYAT